MKVRVVKTASNANAVQVVSYQNNTRIVLQHIGSAHSEAELNDLTPVFRTFSGHPCKLL